MVSRVFTVVVVHPVSESGTLVRTGGECVLVSLPYGCPEVLDLKPSYILQGDHRSVPSSVEIRTVQPFGSALLANFGS